MTARQELVDNGRDAIADLGEQYRAAVGAVVDVVRVATGVDLTPSSRPPIMDATREQLMEAAGRARLALQALDPVLKLHWGDATTLGEVIRDPYWSDEERERMAELLAMAGLS